jgi:AraC-like DNA-binding protein
MKSGRKRVTSEGLFRTVLAGPGHTLAEAFASLEHAPQVERMSRHLRRDLLGARVNLAPEEGKGYWELTRIRNDVFVIIENFAYKNPRIELVPGDGLIQFNFKVSGDMTLAISRKEPLRFNRPSLLVWAQPTGVNIREWTAPSAHERNVAISIHPEFLARHFLASLDRIPEQLSAFVSGDRAKLKYCQLPLTAPMVEMASRLISNPYSGVLGLVYAEALTTQLLCAAIGSLCALTEAPDVEYSDRALRCLHAARELLMKQFSPAPTIRALARAVGMAETAITRDFKAVFGETVLDFSLRCRMQHALALLRDRRWPVARVGEAIGYTHPTSFATAFRRHFGMRPIDVRHVKAPERAGTKHRNS